jgi:hypothetical protein
MRFFFCACCLPQFEEIERQRRQEQKRTCTSILLILFLSAVLMIPGIVSAASFPNATLLGVPLLMWCVFLGTKTQGIGCFSEGLRDCTVGGDGWYCMSIMWDGMG